MAEARKQGRWVGMIHCYEETSNGMIRISRDNKEKFAPTVPCFNKKPLCVLCVLCGG